MVECHKGANNFRGYQEEKQARREVAITSYLKVLKDKKARFKYITDLAKMIALHLTQVEGKVCTHGTLLRNARYKTILLSFMADEIRPGVQSVIGRFSDDPAVQSQLTHLQLANRILTNENQRLKRHIAVLGEEPKQAEMQTQRMKIDNEQDFEGKFIKTCQLLLRIHEYAKDFIEIDIGSARILDPAKRINNTIADGRLTQPFFDWLLATRTR